jgi:hypothetical protein
VKTLKKIVKGTGMMPITKTTDADTASGAWDLLIYSNQQFLKINFRI